MTTTNDNARTWRDLIDDLTPEQVAELEYCEANQIPPGLTEPHHQLNYARAAIRSNLAQAFCAGIETPADAIDEPSVWIEWDDNVYQRVYTVHKQQLGDVVVQVLGYQYSDDRITRAIFVDGDLDSLDAATARTIAAALTAAADQLDGCSFTLKN